MRIAYTDYIDQKLSVPRNGTQNCPARYAEMNMNLLLLGCSMCCCIFAFNFMHAAKVPQD